MISFKYNKIKEYFPIEQRMLVHEVYSFLNQNGMYGLMVNDTFYVKTLLFSRNIAKIKFHRGSPNNLGHIDYNIIIIDEVNKFEEYELEQALFS